MQRQQAGLRKGRGQMKKKWLTAVGIALIASGLMLGCGKKTGPEEAPAPAEEPAVEEAAEEVPEEAAEVTAEEAPEEAAPEEAPAEDGTYQGDGWSVRYDPELFEVNETEEAAYFVYTGESAGTNMIGFSVIPDKMPQEVLGEKTEGWDDADTSRREGFFGEYGWCFWRTLIPKEDSSGLGEHLTAAEYNGGTFLMEVTNHFCGDDAVDMPVADAIADIADSLTFEAFEPQTEFSYVPGTYTRAAGQEDEWTKTEISGSLTLQDDHYGVLALDGEEEKKIIWSSTQLIDASDGKILCQYTVEGDRLYLQNGEEWPEFLKEKEALPEYVYTGENPYIQPIWEYMKENMGKDYDAADVMLPEFILLREDDTDPEDIKVWGRFWIENYSLVGTTLMTRSGGEYPGVAHLKKTDDGFEVTSMDIVEDGSNYSASVEEIFGVDDELKAGFMESSADLDDVRVGVMNEYTKNTGIEIEAVEDYGWDPKQVVFDKEFFVEYPDLSGEWEAEDGSAVMTVELPEEGSVYVLDITVTDADGKETGYHIYGQYEMSTNALYYFDAWTGEPGKEESMDMDAAMQGNFAVGEDNTLTWNNAGSEVVFIRK